MLKVRIILPLACIALGACAPVDHRFGETFHLNNVRQTVNPEGTEASAGAPNEGGSGVRAAGAVDRYERGAVAAPSAPATRSGGGGSGS